MQDTVATAAEAGHVGEAPEAIARLLEQGQEVGPQYSTSGKSLRFVSASWLFVRLRESSTTIAAQLAHSFTATNAGMVWIGTAGVTDLTDCLIGFPLSAAVTDEAEYAALSSGVATLYGVDQPSNKRQAWGASGTGDAVTLTGKLASETTSRLRVVGRETRSHRKGMGKDFLRSKVGLDETSNLRIVDGSDAPIMSVASGTRVFCPVHVDVSGVANVIGKNGAKGVNCTHCRRNYWAVPPQSGNDLGHFRQVFGDLHADEEAAGVEDEGRQFTLLHEPYLPALKLQDGVTLVRSPKGSGKTAALEKLVEECKAKRLSVLLIGHRRALLRALAQRLHLDLYFETSDGGADGADLRTVAPTDGYVVSLDSVPTRLRPDLHKFDVVLIDESEQVIRHIVGATLKAQRRAAFVTFQHYVAAAKSVYLLDADLDALSLSFVLRSGDPGALVRFIVNEPVPAVRPYELVTTREGIMAKLAAALDEGKKCYVATNSKDRASTVALWVKERWTDKRVVLVTRDNASDSDVQDILCDIVTEFHVGRNDNGPIDVLVGSPAIGTGIDISFPDGAMVVDHVFGIFEAGITTHWDVDQQLARVRNPGSLSVWINGRVLHHETSTEAILNELRETVLRTDSLVGFERNGRPIFAENDTPLAELWSEIVAAERGSKNELLDNWVTLRQSSGWTGTLDVASEDEKALGKEAMVEGKAMREAERAKRIVQAPDLDDKTGDDLAEREKLGASITPDERAALEKWRLKRFYVTDVDGALVAFDDGGRTRRKLELLDILVGEAVFNQGIDRAEIDRPQHDRVIAFDRQFRTAKAEILNRLLVAANLVDAATGAFDVDATVCADTLSGFVAAFREDAARVESELGLDMRKDIDAKAVQQLNDVLDLIGTKVALAETTKSGGAKQRFYRMNADGLTALMDIVVRRAARRDEEWAAKRSGDGDNTATIDLYEQERELSPSSRKVGPTPSRKPCEPAAGLAAVLAKKWGKIGTPTKVT